VIVAVAITFAIAFFAQELGARLMGRSLWGARSAFDAPLGRRILLYAAGPVAAYAVAAGCYFAHAMVGGEPQPSLEVEPTPGSPAERAGVAAGDRVVSVSGQTIRVWDEVPAAVRAAGNEPIELVLDRAGRTQSVRLNAEDGRIGLRPRVVRSPLPLGTAARRAVVFPVWTNVSVVGFLAGTTRAELAGPVAIVRETSSAAEPGSLTHLVASALSSALLPAFFVDALLLVVLAVSRRRASTYAKPT
jgi:regulator of sigma E protease